jgi:hypothetical protein
MLKGSRPKRVPSICMELLQPRTANTLYIPLKFEATVKPSLTPNSEAVRRAFSWATLRSVTCHCVAGEVSAEILVTRKVYLLIDKD